MQTASLASPLLSVPDLAEPLLKDRNPDPGKTADMNALLDDPQEWSAFSRSLAGDEELWESHLVIEGMHCAACALTVEDVLMAVPGVASASVSAGSRRARVVWSAQRANPSDWLHAVSLAGYRAVPAHDALAGERRRRETRKALWRWLVAGLCMMQVMMYAWPAYIAEPGDLSAEMEQLLRWASWVLTLPVLIFSCGPFFTSAWRDIVQRRVSMDLPVAIGILITFAVSTAGTFEPRGLFGQQVYFDSLTMFVFFLLTGRWLELRLRDRTAGALDALMNRLPDGVLRQRADGEFERVAARRLQPGDVVRVLPGETFPADGVILTGQTQADEALLTGESRPVLRSQGEPVIAGSHNLLTAVLVHVQRVAGQTRYAQIVALMQSASTSKPQLAQLADRIAKPFLVAVLLAAAGAAAFWWERDPAHALMIAVAVLVVTCPCALSLATPVATLSAAGALARRGVLVRRLQALEALAAVDTVVFDKTGTLTRDGLALGGIRARAGVTPEQALAMAATLAAHSLHPVSRALAAAAGKAGLVPWPVQDVREFAGQGLTGRVMQGAGASPQSVSLGSLEFCKVSEHAPQTPHACMSDADGWLATFELRENVREDAAATVAALGSLGLEVSLWSGDTPQAVARVASAVGISRSSAACTPDGKLRQLQSAQQRGKKVAMVGDGLNDGPVLAAADVSFAVGAAVPLAQAQADFVVLGDDLARIAQSIVMARRTLRIVRQNLVWAAGYNAVCVPMAVVGWMPAWLAGLGMATSSLLVVLNALRLAAGARAERGG